MNKNWIILVIIITIVIIVVPVGLFLNQKSEEEILPDKPNSQPDDSGVFWQVDLENFATGLAVKNKSVHNGHFWKHKLF